MKSQVLHAVWWNVSGEVAEEIWSWLFWEWKGRIGKRVNFCQKIGPPELLNTATLAAAVLPLSNCPRPATLGAGVRWDGWAGGWGAIVLVFWKLNPPTEDEVTAGWNSQILPLFCPCSRRAFDSREHEFNKHSVGREIPLQPRNDSWSAPLSCIGVLLWSISHMTLMSGWDIAQMVPLIKTGRMAEWSIGDAGAPKANSSPTDTHVTSKSKLDTNCLMSTNRKASHWRGNGGMRIFLWFSKGKISLSNLRGTY